MCLAVSYIKKRRIERVYFTQRGAKLPLMGRDQQANYICWGRRQHEGGSLPFGGWARLETIQARAWQKYFPVPVKIAIDTFMEKDMMEKTNWFPLIEHQYIQGLLATYQQEQRVYVVTIPPSLSHSSLYQRWPRIILAKL